MATVIGIAPDGLSFYVAEPLGGRMSRLVMHNLGEGTERHHDLGEMYASYGHERPYSAFYTLDGQEIHMRPSEESGVGLHYFFSVSGDQEARRVRISQTGHLNRVLLVSSEESYYSYSSDRDAPYHRVMKQRLDWSTRATEIVWERSVPYRLQVEGFQVDNDNAWLLFETVPHNYLQIDSFLESDWTYIVLDARTGEQPFVFPVASEEAQFHRLAGVLPAAGASASEIGNIRDAAFIDDQLVIYRVNPKLLDVFDMSTISLESPPSFRIPVNFSYDNRCASQTFPYSLQERKGRLVYAPREAEAG